jgi:hypothetical protein
MEKPGMAGRRKFFRAGLLGFVVFLYVPLALAAGELAVITEAFPENPPSGSLWTLIILADHPSPDEVLVRPPQLPPSLSAESMRTSVRFVSSEDGERPWTEVMYRFTVNGRGRVSVDPFTVSAGGETVETDPLFFDIVEAGRNREILRESLVWEGPAGLVLGKEALFILRAAKPLDPRLDLGQFLAGPVPRGVIMERGLPGEAERSGGVVLRLKVIPLEGTVFILPERSVTAGDRVFAAPALRIPVRKGN